MNKLNTGDVFILPIGDGRAGVGQIVAKYGKSSYYFAIFGGTVSMGDASKSAQSLLAGPIRFLALSLDAKLYVGHWSVVGHGPVEPSVPLLAYKVAIGSGTNIEVVDYSGKRRRPATAIEAEILPYRSTVAPARLERALKASLGMEPWLDHYDELRPEGRVTTADVFG